MIRGLSLRRAAIFKGLSGRGASGFFVARFGSQVVEQ